MLGKTSKYDMIIIRNPQRETSTIFKNRWRLSLWIPNYKYVRLRDFRKQHRRVDQSKNEILPNIEMQNKPIQSDVEYWKQTLCQT